MYYGKRYGGSSKINENLPYNSAISYVDLPKEEKSTYYKKHMHTNIPCNIIYNMQDVEAAYVSVDKMNG